MRGSRGITLVEVLVTTALVTAMVAGLMATFAKIQRGVQRTKARTLAIALCREEMETLKSLRYPLLRPTTQADLDAYGYDQSYYPAEIGMVSGGLRFSRFNAVRKVYLDGAGAALPLPPGGADAGLKSIEVWVTWSEEGRQVRYSMSALVDNPSRVLPQGAITGTVYRAPGGAGSQLAGVTVLVEQNSSRRDLTGSSGAYRIETTTGAFTLQARKAGYFSARASVIASPNAAQDFTLVARGSGTIRGFAYVRDHPVISRVVLSTTNAGFEAQYVELYNPTTAPLAVSGLSLRYRSPAAPFDCPSPALTIVSTSVPSYGFYLIGNAAAFTVAGTAVTADAYFSDTAGTVCSASPPGWSPPALRRFLQPSQAGSLALQDSSGRALDVVGWTAGGAAPSPCEGSCLATPAGPLAGQQVTRVSTPTAATGSGAPSYDSGDNSVDLVLSAAADPARTSASAPWTPVTGTPAVGALVSADDDLSAPAALSSSTGWFALPSVASCTETGAPATWTVTVSSGLVAGTAAVAAPAAGAASDAGVIALTAPSGSGIVSGTVLSSTGAALAGVVVTCAGASGATDASGVYRLVVPAGTGLYAAANPGRADPTLATALSAVFDLPAGGSVSPVDFTLETVGSVAGVVTTDGVNPYPGLVVEADAPAGTLRGTAAADATGRFELDDLPISSVVGTYTVFPVCDSSQASTPGTAAATVTAGAQATVSTFTISRALGQISGSVTDAGKPVATGVLILASQAALGAAPPAWDETLRASSTYYYSALTRSDGTFTLPVRVSASPYNVYAWYSKVTGDTTTATLLKTATQVVASPTSYTVSFSFP